MRASRVCGYLSMVLLVVPALAAEHGVQGVRRGVAQCQGRLQVDSIPRWEDDLVIPPVLYDDHETDGSEPFQVAVRQITQQILPAAEFPATTLWAYGNPDDASTFHHPAFTFEVTKDKTTKVAWINELVQDPETCRCDPTNMEACQHLKHILQDENGNPIVDQTMYWANPAMECQDGQLRTDCRGTSREPYLGPIPIVTHLHGSHADSSSDGYPEAWYLPRASHIGAFSPGGRSYEAPTESLAVHGCDARLEESGFTVGTYTNDQPTTTLWYHDHTIGITKLNVYAMGAGFWLIRDEEDGETGLIRGTLPGPAPQLGEDPNGADRAKIREIPIAVQQKSFACDGSLYFQEKNKNSNETRSGEADMVVSDAMVVNGNTWPKLEVAPVRYRFRILNAAAKGYLGPAIFKNGNMNEEELPLYIIGSDQSLLPRVAKVTTRGSVALPGDGTDPEPEEDEEPFWIGPGERYDVIVDFTGLVSGDEYILINTNPKLDGQVLKFIINEDLGTSDTSTHPKDLVLNYDEPGGAARLVESSVTRDLALLKMANEECSYEGRVGLRVDPAEASDCLSKKKGEKPKVIGIHGSNMAKGLEPLSRYWDDPITENPQLNAVETWEFWNAWVGNKGRHPIHAHLVKFLIVGRRSYFPINTKESDEEKAMEPPKSYEAGWKDIVIAPPGKVTSVIAKFDKPGHYVTHCHILNHEDYEMMRPFCVGDACNLVDVESS